MFSRLWCSKSIMCSKGVILQPFRIIHLFLHLTPFVPFIKKPNQMCKIISYQMFQMDLNLVKVQQKSTPCWKLARCRQGSFWYGPYQRNAAIIRKEIVLFNAISTKHAEAIIFIHVVSKWLSRSHSVEVMKVAHPVGQRTYSMHIATKQAFLVRKEVERSKMFLYSLRKMRDFFWLQTII